MSAEAAGDLRRPRGDASCPTLSGDGRWRRTLTESELDALVAELGGSRTEVLMSNDLGRRFMRMGHP